MPSSVWAREAEESLSIREFVSNIWFKALKRLERRQGSFTALMCLDSVIEEHKPFGDPKSMIERM
jgi:hypothetical protein